MTRHPTSRGIDTVVDSSPAGAVPSARAAAARGHDGCWVGEINHDPFLAAADVADATDDCVVGTSIAVAFARSPMSVATTAWDLQERARGRFVLGLGSQVKAHVERRYGMPWGRPVARMTEYVAAVRAIWAAWSEGSPLDFTGDFHQHTLMTPMFTPEPLAHPTPPIFLAAVGPQMTRAAGQVADGLFAHAFTTSRYLAEVTLPAVEQGLAASGRDRAAFTVCAPAFVATGCDEGEVEQARDAVRARVGFYASTPAYRAVMDLHGWGDLQDELAGLARAGRFADLGARVDDGVLDAFVVSAPLDTLAQALIDRWQPHVDRLLLNLPDHLPAEAIAAVIGDLRAAWTDPRK